MPIVQRVLRAPLFWIAVAAVAVVVVILVSQWVVTAVGAESTTDVPGRVGVPRSHPGPDLPSLPWPRSVSAAPCPCPFPSSVRDSCLRGWSTQALGSHSTVVVVCGGDVVVVAVDVAVDAAALAARADVVAVGSV